MREKEKEGKVKEGKEKDEKRVARRAPKTRRWVQALIAASSVLQRERTALKVMQQIYPCTRLSLWERCVEIEAPAGSDIVRPPNPGFTDVTTVRVILADALELISA